MNSMKISIIGTGYVGCVTGVGFAELGHEIFFYDIDYDKLLLLQNGKIPFFEPGINELLNKKRTSIHICNNLEEAIDKTEITFICVGTPSNSDGSLNLDFIRNVSFSLGEALKSKDERHLIVVKSTVLPGTAETVIAPIIEQASNKTRGIGFEVVSNPEFLREGNALDDFFHPDRVIIGSVTFDDYKKVEELYAPLKVPLYRVDLKTSEMIKYASNAFLALKISFSNEIGNICKRIGIDSYDVLEGVGMDSRIGGAFFRSGLGFGGSCFPKDLNALIHFARSVEVIPYLMEATWKINIAQPLLIIGLLKKHLGDLRGKRIGLLGLAFKPDTDDIRESRAIPIVNALMKESAEIIAYDPMAMTLFKRQYPEICYANNAKDVLQSNAVVIITEWAEFEELNYSETLVIDGRNNKKARREAKEYEGICW